MGIPAAAHPARTGRLGLNATAEAAPNASAPARAVPEGASAASLRDRTPNGLPFPSPWLLAPMEGVTDPAFREVVCELHGPDDLGGTFTEFLPVSHRPPPLAVFRRHLGPPATGKQVCGLQLMGAEPDVLAEATRRAEEAGAPLVDLNFGCPASGALRRCAGAAALASPARLERLVRACVDAASAVAVTAKIRAGVDDAERLEDLARAVEAGGATLLTVHCRTRAEGYRDPADWSRIARAVGAVGIPVCGNGGVRAHADLERMRRETGCRLVMVGRAALGDPWIFSGRRVAAPEAFAFLWRYVEAMRRSDARDAGALAGRVKQLLRHWRAGAAVDHDRSIWLRERDPDRLLERLAALAGRGAGGGIPVGPRPVAP